jgi:para-nitrobenzyl esterase
MPNRLSFAAVLGLAVANPVTAQSVPVAATDAGKVAGSTDEGVVSWKGIPFAAPPVGALRWRAPQPVAHWPGVKAATAYGHDCMQEPFPSDAAPLGTPPAEDCLYANVWKPAAATAKLPVLVWIYGGGFLNGGASPPTYSGANLAAKGVLVISFNYRVGRFGFFAHPALTKANADGGLFGNYGFLDQIAALKWVRRNVAAFGGDPTNVTVMGESAGGFSVHNLITSPMSQGLFERAIIMSGGGGSSLGAGDLAAAEKVGVAFAAGKGIKADDPAALVKLRALSAADVTSGLNMVALFTIKPEDRNFISPFVDGKIAVDGLQAYASGKFAKVPVMVGATSDDVGGKLGFAAQARQSAIAISGKGAPVYEYRFSYVAESIARPGAQHATDIPFFMDTQAIKYGATTTGRDNRMGDTVSTYIVNFTKSGDPNGAGLPQWPRYVASTDQIMDFAASGEAMPQVDPWAADMAKAPLPGQ